MTDRSGPTIRPMQAADITRVMQIADGLLHAPHWPVSAYQSALNSNAVPSRISLVAEDPASEGVFGFVVASLVAGEAELESIAVAGEAQRRGVGGHLLNEMAAALRQCGVTRIHLEVRASNHPALSLYKRYGFTEIGRRVGYYGEPAEDAVLLSVDLG